MTMDKKIYFETNIVYDEYLLNRISEVKDYKKRKCIYDLKNFIYKTQTEGKVFILYGLRRTGKTTLMLQAINEMSHDDFCKSVFIQITKKDTIGSLNRDLKKLDALGYKYIFIDEVTEMDDFIDCSSLLSDIHAACGMKIVLSGTNSLGFIFASQEQLYDRCYMLHTTYIPFIEFKNVLDINDIDIYMQYGGTMCANGKNYNKSPFCDVKSCYAYTNSAIAINIQKTLENYQFGKFFDDLYILYKKRELTNAINRIVEDMNHDIAIDVLVRDFKSHNLGISRRNINNDDSIKTKILDHIDKMRVTQQFMENLYITNNLPKKHEVSNDLIEQIRRYLQAIDFLHYIKVYTISDTKIKEMLPKAVFSQPGLRYCQAEALIRSIQADKNIDLFSEKDKKETFSRIMDEIKGRLLEEIVLYETKLAQKKREIFVLRFDLGGEFDMVSYDYEKNTCAIYEIKHSKAVDERQTIHLNNQEKCAKVEKYFGNIMGKFVVYRGENCDAYGVKYINVEKYLGDLWNQPKPGCAPGYCCS